MAESIEVKSKAGKKLLKICMGDIYANPMVVFREYVQNSCDSLHEAERNGMITDSQEKIISITIHTNSITVHDRGVGVKKDDVASRLIDLSYSNKDDYSIGRYGIGRLTGAKYCDELIFETSAKGEPYKSMVYFDAKHAREILDSDIEDELTNVVDKVTSHQIENEDPEQHYFRVTMKNVQEEHLLNIEGVQDYLSMTIPVQYEEAFLDEILMPSFDKEPQYLDYYKDLPQCIVCLNGKDVRKPYDTIFKNSQNESENIGKAKLFQLKNEDEILAWGWYSMSASGKQFTDVTSFRKIRLRQLNMTVGDDTTLDSLYDKEVDALYFIGEIHVVHKLIEPTTGREGLSDCKEKKLFERRLKEQLLSMKKEYNNLSKYGSEGLLKYAQAVQTIRTINKQVSLGINSSDDTKEELKKANEQKKSAEESILDYNKKLAKIGREDLVEDLIDYYQKKSDDSIDKYNCEKSVQKSNTIIQKINITNELDKILPSDNKEDTPVPAPPKEKDYEDEPSSNEKKDKEPTELDVYESLTPLQKDVVKKVYHILNNEKKLDDKVRGKIKQKIEKALIK